MFQWQLLNSLVRFDVLAYALDIKSNGSLVLFTNRK